MESELVCDCGVGIEGSSEVWFRNRNVVHLL